MDFKKRIIEIENETSKYENVKVIAATKYMNTDQTKALVEAGVKCLGENRTDLFLEKYEALKDYDIEWHFFGVLQSRKIKDVAKSLKITSKVNSYGPEFLLLITEAISINLCFSIFSSLSYGSLLKFHISDWERSASVFNTHQVVYIEFVYSTHLTVAWREWECQVTGS